MQMYYLKREGKNSIFSPNYEMFFVNLTKLHYFQALIRGMQRFIDQNGILQGGSFSNFRGNHTYQIFEEVPRVPAGCSVGRTLWKGDIFSLKKIML